MKGMSGMSKVMLGIMSLTLSTSVFAGSALNTYVVDPFTHVVQTTGNVVMMPLNGWHKGWCMEKMNQPDYLVTDTMHHKVTMLDGIENGHVVSHQGDMMTHHDYMKGDTITNIHTQKSGIIKGVKHQGTMDVMTPNGHTVRYQYVTFKVKPL